MLQFTSGRDNTLKQHTTAFYNISKDSFFFIILSASKSCKLSSYRSFRK